MKSLTRKLVICLSLVAFCLSLSLKTFAQEQVSNAGIVLANNYIPVYFARLGLTVNNQFVSKQAQIKAVHFLQLFSTGGTSSSERILNLNKILCGLSAADSTDFDFVPTQTEIQLTESLIQAMIAHWTSIGASSIDGFRGNWIIRNGVLFEQSDLWQMTVERRAYDVLLSRSPFSFSIIRYPWMAKPIYVTWPN